MTVLVMFQRVESTQQFLCYDCDIQEVGRYLKNLKTGKAYHPQRRINMLNEAQFMVTLNL